MALSTKARKRLEVAVARRVEGKEIADAIDAGDGSQPTLLASTANGEGASLIGVEDAGSFLAATNVEDALVEVLKYIPLNLADPGTGVAIPVARSATVAITTAAAETNTLADPTFIGQKLILVMNVRVGGDRVVSAASDVTNTPGENVMTFGAAGDMIVLEAVRIGGALKWRVTANDGVVLS